MKLILFAFLLFKIILKIFLIPYVACIISMKQCRSKKSTCGCKGKPAVHKGETGLFLQAIITPHQVRLDKAEIDSCSIVKKMNNLI